MGIVTIFVTGLFEQTLILQTHKSSTWNLTSMDLAASQQMLESDHGQRSDNDRELLVYIYMFVLTLSTIFTNFQFTDFNSFYKI